MCSLEIQRIAGQHQHRHQEDILSRRIVRRPRACRTSQTPYMFLTGFPSIEAVGVRLSHGRPGSYVGGRCRSRPRKEAALTEALDEQDSYRAAGLDLYQRVLELVSAPFLHRVSVLSKNSKHRAWRRPRKPLFRLGEILVFHESLGQHMHGRARYSRAERCIEERNDRG